MKTYVITIVKHGLNVRESVQTATTTSLELATRLYESAKDTEHVTVKAYHSTWDTQGQCSTAHEETILTNIAQSKQPSGCLAELTDCY